MINLRYETSKEDDNFIIACDDLSIYCQSKDEETLYVDFFNAIKMLLSKWRKDKTLDDKLKSLST